MARLTAPRVRMPRPGELDERALWSPTASARTSVAPLEVPTPAHAADRFLAPEHPFLRSGTWRAFVADDPRSCVRVVASLDSRQRVDGVQVGAIGFVAVGGDLRAARRTMRAALQAAEAWCVENGAGVVRCPVQFSTWYGHRLMTDGSPERGGEPLFAMESPAIPGLATTLARDGFTVAHAAGSYLVDVERWVAGARRGEETLRAAGFRDRPLRLDHLDDELRAIHAISVASFTRSWGFCPIGFDEFASIYRPLVGLVDPDFVRILEATDGEPVGFVFAVPDLALTSSASRRFVVKSAAVLPEVRRRTPGVGTGLAVAVHRIAAAHGYRSAIHAFVADGAYSQRVSAAWGERFRSYATYEKALG